MAGWSVLVPEVFGRGKQWSGNGQVLFVRVNHYNPQGGGRKALEVKKKKTLVKQGWDNTVNDCHFIRQLLKI